jgi:hypothetical protein
MFEIIVLILLSAIGVGVTAQCLETRKVRKVLERIEKLTPNQEG